MPQRQAAPEHLLCGTKSLQMEVTRPTDKKSMFSNDTAKNSLKLSERSWNFYEKKGQL
jgi:hypothetical protein